MNKSRIKKFFSYYKPYKWLFAADVICSVTVAVTSLLLPLCVRYVTKDVLTGNSNSLLLKIAQAGAVMLIIIAVQTACKTFYDYRGHAMGAMMERDLRNELFDKFEQLSFSFYDEQRTGALMSRITNDLLAMAELYHHVPEDTVIYVVKFIGAVVILFTVNIRLSLIVLLFIPLMILYALYFNKKLRVSYRENLKRISDVNGQVEDSLAGIRVVQSFTNEEYEGKKFRGVNNIFLKGRTNIYRSEAFLDSGMEAFMQILTVCVIVFGGIAISAGTLDMADLITFLLYAAYLVEPIPRLLNITRLLQEGLSGFTRFMEIMELVPDVRDREDAIVPEAVRGDIVFSEVSFKYDEGQDNILKNISLEIKKGDYVALVGISGAGKTTLCSLIPRFYDTVSGSITLDGVDIRKIKLSALRKNIGFVHQDVYLFNTTVKENIRYGRREADDAQIIEAAKNANAHEFIMALPKGYDTVIGQRGIKLSGGQKQRLGIARAFLKNPAVMIFDEATSSLDNESERAVQESLERLAENRTTLVIAHRLSTVKNTKRIVVLSENGIEEQGTHEELLELNGEYAKLYSTYKK